MNLKSVLKKLDLLDKSELFDLSDLENSKFTSLNNRVKESLLKIKPDAFFCINDEPLILFFENPDNLEKIQRQIWNFNQSPAIFINENNQWVIKNGFNLLENKQDLETITNDISDFEYFKIITGQTWTDYKHYFENKNRVDTYLLANIETARNILINKGNLHPTIANSLIGRVIFIRYLIDKQVELNKYQILNNNDFYTILSDINKTYKFFKQIREDFNGNLFPLKYKIEGREINEEEKINEFHLSTIISLLKGDKLFHSGKSQISLFDIYDFSIIPIEFISNVYERFIGSENQAKSGAYYTPLFLVDYIQKETVSKYFENNPTEYNCKVLDPACGSGIFLVETLRQIISQYKKNNPSFDSEENYDKYKETIKQLLLDNIFGIDKDENAISVAIFSLYITLLDNLTPKSIVGFRFPELIDTNFFSNDFFDLEKPFNDKLKKHHFQFILGNPPWATSHNKAKQLFETYIENRKNSEKSNLEIVHREIAEAFLVRVSDFNFNETGFIVVSKILYKLEKNGVFRSYFLQNFKIRQVFELSSVRHQVFNSKDAVAPATIIFYSKPKNIDEVKKNTLNHISLKPNIFFDTFRLMVIEKYDNKEILQNLFIENDWLWKVLVYGNILDYFFIKRLKKNYKTIGQITSDNKKFRKGQGLKFKDGIKKINTENFKDYKFIGTLEKKIDKNGKLKDATTNYKKYLSPYHIKNNLEDWDSRDVGYFPDDSTIFEGPALLITGGVSKKFISISAILYEKALYKSSLTAIKAINKEEIEELKTISAILNSSFFAYYILANGSSTGIEREEVHDTEKWDTPYVSNQKLVKKVSLIEKLIANYNSAIIKDDTLKAQIETEKLNIENNLLEIFNTTKQERHLIDYTNNITIPILKGTIIEKRKTVNQLKRKDTLLKEYAQVYINHFGNRFNSDNHFFEVEVIHSNHTILIKFKVIPTPSKQKNSILWKNEGDKKLLKNIASLSFQNLSTALYLQKDIKGFEKDFFYIAKPNQYKSWHPAIAHLDLAEFIDALQNSKTKING